MTYVLPPAECPCGLKLWRRVLDDWTDRDDWLVEACAGCRAVHVAIQHWEEIDPHQSAVVAHTDVEVADEVSAWLCAWPRVVASDWGKASRRDIDAKRPFFLSPTDRYVTRDDLEEAEDRAAWGQASMPMERRLRQAGVPARPAPEDMPVELEPFLHAWWALEVTEEAAAASLLGGPRRRRRSATASMVIVRDKAERDGFVDMVTAALEGDDADRRLRALQELYDWRRWRRPVPPELCSPVVDLLDDPAHRDLDGEEVWAIVHALGGFSHEALRRVGARACELLAELAATDHPKMQEYAKALLSHFP